MPHRHVVHTDDVEPLALDQGDLRFSRRRLGAAAGTARAGLSRWDIAAGARSTPPHTHSDEEEIFFVLRGSGLSWQAGKGYAVGPGDCLVHVVDGPAHTLLAGPDGLDVLAFAEGSRTHLTWMPRTKMLWAAARWVPGDAPHPFAADAALGPLEVPRAAAERPGSIVALTDVDARQQSDDLLVRDLGSKGGSVSTGLQHLALRPGGLSYVAHCHSAEEEVFVVLEGDGVVVLGEEEVAVRAGCVVARPPGTGVPHRFRAGDDGMALLAWGTRRTEDTVWYPDTKTLSIRGLGPVRFHVEPVARPSEQDG